MMITAIEIENFKAIRDRVRVEFKPITLLFGPNSAGKSTIVQALHYAREVFERHNLDPDRTLHGGHAVELGGFRNLLHNHNNSRPLILRFELDLGAVDLPDYDLDFDPFALNPITEHSTAWNISREAKSAWVEVVIPWSDVLQAPYVSTYEVGINGRIFARIKSSEDLAQMQITDLDLLHPVFPGESDGEEERGAEFEVLFLNIVRDTADEQYKPELGVLGQRSALPDWDRPLRLEERWVDGADQQQVKGLTRVLSQALVGPGQILRDVLRGFRYVGPLRDVPPRNYEATKSPEEGRWASGLGAWDALHENGDTFIREVSDWLSRADRLDAGYELRMKRYKEIDTTSALMLALSPDRALDDFEELRADLDHLPTKRRLVLVENGKELEILPPDVGVGVSQVLPVVVAALDDGADLVAIEQPELHIHPAIQVRLADLFISQIDGPKTFLLETHSEHLLLRLLRRIRETTEESPLPPTFPLRPDLLSVVYIEPTADGAKLSTLRVDATGEFIDRWPKGFFEEREDELF